MKQKIEKEIDQNTWKNNQKVAHCDFPAMGFVVNICKIEFSVKHNKTYNYNERECVVKVIEKRVKVTIIDVEFKCRY